jgi:hypothetical protein
LSVGQRNRRGLGPAGHGQQARGLRGQRGAFFCAVVDGADLQRVAGACQLVRAAQLRAGPGAGRQQFGWADAAILVGVDQVQRALVELDAAGGAGQGYPEFLVQLGQVGDVLAALDDDLVHAAGAKELPGMLGWRLLGLQRGTVGG